MSNHYRKAEPVVPNDKPDGEYSWLGRWSDNGWAIRIEPKLSPREWDKVLPDIGQTYSKELGGYDPMASLEFLEKAFPRRTFNLMWPRCGKRIESIVTKDGEAKRYVVLCAALARHTDTALIDVHGRKTAIARCELHRGQL